MAQLLEKKPPTNSDVRKAIIDILKADLDLDAWLSGDNPQSYDEGEFDAREYEAAGEWKDLGIRIDISGILRKEPPESCDKFLIPFTIWVFYAGGNSTLAHDYLGKIEEALEANVIQASVFMNRTIVLQNIKWDGRPGATPVGTGWGVNSMFIALARYV